jgi:hypothetical protein
MSFLDQLTADQRDMIVSLPYRVGLWVSDSDKSGGGDASMEEMQALSGIIHGFADEMFGSEVMQQIISETISKKSRWGEWAKTVNEVPEDCRFAIDVIKEKTSNKDATVFRNHLMEIGEAVAMAFHEERAKGISIGAYFSYLFGKLTGRRGARSATSFSDYLRISVSEHKALAALAQALGAAY